MTLSTFLILYVVGMVVSFFLSPIVLGVDKPNDLLIVSLCFPLFWFIGICTLIYMGLGELAQMYIDFLEKRNEK